MKLILSILALTLSSTAFAHPQYCENQFEKYCQCEESWGSYAVQFIILDLKTNTQKKRMIGLRSYSGTYAQQSCFNEMATIPLCNR